MLHRQRSTSRSQCRSSADPSRLGLQIEHLDGHKVPLQSQGVTVPGQVRTIKGEGMPRFQDGHLAGDLHVVFTVTFPASLSEHQKGLVRKMALQHDEL